MSSIDVTKSDALLLAQEIEQKLQPHLGWIQTFEYEILTARSNYDSENIGYDALYPEKSVLEERYTHWAGRLQTFTKRQQELAALANPLNEEFARLKSWVIEEENLSAKLSRIHREAGPLLDAYHLELQARVARLTHNLKRINELVRVALTEIYWIEYHPHKRLQQTIERVDSGYVKATVISSWGDKVSRYYHEYWGGQSSSSSSNDLPPPQNDSGKTISPQAPYPNYPLTGQSPLSNEWPPPPRGHTKPDTYPTFPLQGTQTSVPSPPFPASNNYFLPPTLPGRPPQEWPPKN